MIDGEAWIAARLKFLRELLLEDLSDEERRALEAEIETLSKEGGILPGGFASPASSGVFAASGKDTTRPEAAPPCGRSRPAFLGRAMRD